jgi:patatin-like phospholipase/acyl hydrolase
VKDGGIVASNPEDATWFVAADGKDEDFIRRCVVSILDICRALLNAFPTSDISATICVYVTHGSPFQNSSQAPGCISRYNSSQNKILLDICSHLHFRK